MPSALESRLDAVYSEEPATRVGNGSANWPGGFGGGLNEIRSVVIHLTAGWPSRDNVEEFVKRYIGPPPGNRPEAGVGPQFFVVGDGTAFRLINMPSITWHAQDPINNWAIGVELANLGTVARPQFPIPADPDFDNRWRALGPGNQLNDSDIPGAKLWLSTQRFHDAVVSWWTTSTYNGPVREPLTDHPRMLFTEAQYRGWALLARYICEHYELPRNFPVLPHALRSRVVDQPSLFRRIAFADERFPMIVRALSAYNVEESHFQGPNATFDQRYNAAIRARGIPGERDERRNLIWHELFNVYRGFHGHGFSGAPRLVRIEKPKGSGTFIFVNADHDCPGPLFDWHRFAREVWDWWWYPFDFLDGVNPTTQRRPYRRPSGNTPLIEYYFDSPEAQYVARQENTAVGSNGIFDGISSPSTFRLVPNVPVYAPANGELIAARFPNTGDRVSMAFVLLRHEVFHRPNTLTVDIEGVGSLPAHPGRIDYELEPTYVYSLVMHIGRPEGMSFVEVNDENPDWLNRVLIRKKECDLSIARYDGSANHGGVAQAAWESRPPGNAGRPSPIDGFRMDQRAYQFLLDRLSAGEVAVSQAFYPNVTPIRIILGDFLGQSGVIRKEGSNVQHGIGLEIFASGFVPPTFASHQSQNGWFIQPGGPTGRPPAVFYQTEWSKTPTPEERQRLEGIGVNPDLVNWWSLPALSTQLDGRLPAASHLIEEGWAFHFRPLDFMRWINSVTWTSEWPKYQVKDEQGQLVPMSPNHTRPRSRRV